MERIDYLSLIEEVMKQIKTKGAFLIVKSKKKVNIMNIGWASIGYIWKRPIFIIAIRKSRYTYTLLEKATSFTINVPEFNMGNELNICGTKSGRVVDKFKLCNLKTITSKKVETPIINILGIHYECKIIYKSELNASNLCSDILKEYKEDIYQEGDYHTLFFGEILDCYKTF